MTNRLEDSGIAVRVRIPLTPVKRGGLSRTTARVSVTEPGLLLVRGHDTGPWEVEVGFAIGVAGAVPVSVSLRSTTGAPVSATAWRSVKPGEAITRARAAAWWLEAPTTREDGTQETVGGYEGANLEVTDVQVSTSKARRTGRPRRYSDDDLRAVARVYEAARAAGESPVRAVARAYEIPDRETRARYLVAETRRRGFLD